MKNLPRDLRFAFRSLRKSPGFFLLAVLTLGLGAAATTAIFSLFYQVLLRSLPVQQPERLVVLHAEGLDLPGNTSKDNYENVFSYPFYLSLRDHAKGFQGLAVRVGDSVQLEAHGQADRSDTELVSGNFFDVLGVHPAAGRLLSPSDDIAGKPNPVAVLSYDFWTRRFGNQASVVSQSLTLDGSLFTIVGVAPEGFRGIHSGNSPDLFLPVTARGLLEPAWSKSFSARDTHWLTVFGRLAPGLSRQQAAAALQPLFASNVREAITQLKITNRRKVQELESKHPELLPASQGLNELEKQWRQPLLVLIAMAGLLLLIGCANLANLLLARGLNRSRDTAIRSALGASRGRIASMLLAESLLVAAGGVLLGLALTPLLTGGILRLLPEGELSGWVSSGIQLPILAFCCLLLLLTGVLSGLAPAWQSAHTNETALLSDRTGQAGSLSPHVRKALVVAQLALALVLLSTAGLFGRSLSNLIQHNPGFRAENLLTFSIDAGGRHYSLERAFALYHDLSQRLMAQPGVESAAYAFNTPLSGSESGTNVTVEGYTEREGEDMGSDVNAISPGYFHALGSPLVSGREFGENDNQGAAKVAIVNRAFVKRFIPGRDALGVKMRRGGGKDLDLTIVGVVPDIDNNGLRKVAEPTFYLPFPQGFDSKQAFVPKATFIIRTYSNPEAMGRTVRTIAAQVDRSLPVYHLDTMQTTLNNTIYTERLLAALTTACGVLALLLTAVGLYGVISFVVGRRTAEIGIRMALGATGSSIMGLVLREVAIVSVAGAVLGAIGALAATKTVQSQLYGIGGFDPFVLAAAVVILFAVALSAAAIPALRAAGIQPLQALRHE
jgi:predicted permease